MCTLDAEITTDKGIVHVDLLDAHVDVVGLFFVLLFAIEGCARSKERRGDGWV